MNNFFRTSLQALVIAAVITCLTTLNPGLMAQSCNVACNDQMVVSVPPGGTYELLPQTASASDLSVFCPNGIFNTQFLNGSTWEPASGNATFNDSHVGQTFQYRLRDAVSGVTCWGYVEVTNPSPLNDTVHFHLSAELWSDGRPINGAKLVFQPINPAFPYTPMEFELDEDQNGVDLSIIPADYLPGTTFSYGAVMPDTGYLNGVGVLDICQMSRHILGIEPLPSPYAMIAADINKSGSVTTFDIVESRRLMLNVLNELPNNNAWRLFPDYCQFPNPSNPFLQNCISEISLTELLALDNDTARVYGVKIGDVDGDVQMPGTVNPILSTADTITMLIPQGPIQANTSVAVPVKLDKDFSYGGLQLVIQLPPNVVQVDSISSGAILVPPSGALIFYHYDDGELRVVLLNQAHANPVFIPANTPLFYIHLKSTQTVQLQDIMQLKTDDSKFPPMLIGSNCSGIYHVGATYAGFVPVHTPLAKGVLLHPPSPNPFASQSWLELELEQPENVSLEIADLTGRILHREIRQIGPGATRWELPVENIPSGAICLWRLVIAGKSASGKLVKK